MPVWLIAIPLLSLTDSKKNLPEEKKESLLKRKTFCTEKIQKFSKKKIFRYLKPSPFSPITEHLCPTFYKESVHK